ncbi:hypothetical protein [Paenibacillus motobuensis]|uniref:YqzN/YkzM domain-containing protein n=1 Tax=Paenibacillus motobuensis TaxID=295324 RepID=A0ABN0YCI4_9BACL
MADKPEKKIESKYPIKELMANAEALFSVRPEVLVGALHGVKASELSVTEAKSLVKSFLERKVN